MLHGLSGVGADVGYDAVAAGQRFALGDLRRGDEAARGACPEVDFVAGVPDSGVPHAIGYSTESGMPFGRPFIKYTPTWPRSFMPANQDLRNKIANMKQVPVPELIRDKKLLFVDDSIVRGTTMTEIVRMARECNRHVELVDCLVDGAFGLDQDQFKARMTEMAGTIADKVDVIVFAQGSMAYCEQYIADKFGKVVLSSPRFGAAELKKALEKKGTI